MKHLNVDYLLVIIISMLKVAVVWDQQGNELNFDLNSSSCNLYKDYG